MEVGCCNVVALFVLISDIVVQSLFVPSRESQLSMESPQVSEFSYQPSRSSIYTAEHQPPQQQRALRTPVRTATQQSRPQHQQQQQQRSSSTSTAQAVTFEQQTPQQQPRTTPVFRSFRQGTTSPPDPGSTPIEWGCPDLYLLRRNAAVAVPLRALLLHHRRCKRDSGLCRRRNCLLRAQHEAALRASMYKVCPLLSFLFVKSSGSSHGCLYTLVVIRSECMCFNVYMTSLLL